jgi:hypothetical protein
MVDAFSTQRNRIKSLIFLAVCGLSAIVAAVIGIDDNPPGIVLAFLAGIAFVLAFVHPWRAARKFLSLLGAAVLGFALFIVLNIVSDAIVQNPSTAGAIRGLMQSPASDALNLIFVVLCASAFIVGSVGSAIMFIRSRRQTI